MKFSQAFISASSLFVIGLVLWSVFSVKLSLLGALGWWSISIGVVSGAVSYFLLFAVTKAFWINVPSMRVLMKNLHDLFREFSWFAIIVISILAGVGEELLMRGVLQTALVSFLGPAFGILLTSLVFGLMHYLSKTYVLVTFGLGFGFGLAYYFTDSLLLVMVAHAVYDVFAFAVIVKFPSLLNIDTTVNRQQKLLIK